MDFTNEKKKHESMVFTKSLSLTFSGKFLLEDPTRQNKRDHEKEMRVKRAKSSRTKYAMI
jgi:hypothetical protein